MTNQFVNYNLEELSKEAYKVYESHVGQIPTYISKDGQVKQNKHNNEVYAFRHAYVSGKLAKEYGTNTADVLGVLYEMKGETKGKLHYYSDKLGADLYENQKADSPEKIERERIMDLWNNRIGREINEKSATQEAFKLKIKE